MTCPSVPSQWPAVGDWVPSHDRVSLTAHSQTSINRRHTCSKHSANIQTLAHVSEWLTLVPNSESNMLKFSGFIFKLQNGPVADNILQNLSSQTGFYTFSSYVQTFVKQRNHSYVSFFLSWREKKILNSIWRGKEVNLVIKRSTNVCSRRFTSGYILGCSDAALTPGLKLLIQKWSLFSSDSTNGKLHWIWWTRTK